ncbi:MAG: hypothetical protein E6K80_02640 [Candidatus Eisenbacteria bacterium]|uniref:peptidylprolyl isomerase n=1 Tax=Eiseniibacteriota bacterium TaxID=2212470 RepID=A0A538U9U8_UNCEI|nr:MAG: hypothetical protein E6K80_02640 [Candidatus Eisenbacteria bacterium]
MRSRPSLLRLALASACLLSAGAPRPALSAVARGHARATAPPSGAVAGSRSGRAVPPTGALAATLRAIAIAEDERRFRPELAAGLASRDPVVRARAALAVGRLQDSTTVAALEPLLADPDPKVRREAVFALGQIGHRSAREALEARLADQDPEVVARAAEALGKLGDKTSTPQVTSLLASSSAALRATAAMALWRLADSTALDPLLAHHQDPDPDVRWHVLHALENIKAPDRVAPVAAQHLADDPSALVRAYAARTLGRQKAPRAIPALLQAHGQPDVPVVVNAIRALQLVGDTTCVHCGAALAQHIGHRHPYVRASVAVALADRFAWAAADTADRRAILDSLAAHRGDDDVATRTAAGRALLRIRGDAALGQVRPLLFGDLSIYVRTGVMDALRDLPTRQSWQSFFQQRLDPDRPLLERMTAADVMGARREPESAPLLREGLACASALAEMKDSASIPALVQAYAAHAASADPDARIGIRDALRDLAGRSFADSIERLVPAHDDRLASYAADFGTPPRTRGAILHTERGDIEWAFYGREAPETVRNFVRLAKRGFFDGRVFHRVVPNFVIQDGDPTGTGSGGPGYTIRCEYNALHYGPGMVGMALSGKDTGGSQWFITHSPQPHLDGRYTIFAHVVKGMDVVDRIVQGDHVYTVEILE